MLFICGQKIFHCRIVNIWNNLDNNIKLIIDVNSFRVTVKGVGFKREDCYIMGGNDILNNLYFTSLYV